METTSVPTTLLGHAWAAEFVGKSHRGAHGAHAYLLVGPAHVGKFTTALAVARALLCSAAPPCGTCRHCTLTAHRAHPDLRVLELPPDRKTIPLHDVHEFTQGIALRPLEASCKVYIIRNADALADEGANALLKTIEEPPPAVVIVLTAPSAASVLATIVSRCQVLALRGVDPAQIEAHLRVTLDVPADRAAVIARASRGRPGWAILAARNPSLLDQHQQSAGDLLHLLRASRLERITYADAMAERWSAHADDVRATFDVWIDVWRDVLFVQEGAEPARADGDLAEAVVGAAGGLPPAAVRGALAASLDAIDALDRNANPRLFLETYALLLPRLRPQL